MLPFVDDILKYPSLSIVGMEKNTGKTECLNYVLAHLPVSSRRVAITSIGIDGEGLDQVTHTAKPEITLAEGIYFGTTEGHYRRRRLVSELVDVSDETTSMGRVVTARVLQSGKVLIAGPSSTAGLQRWMRQMQQRHDIDLVIVDGALSRLSLASPAVSQAMILATGAALSPNVDTLVRKTAFTVGLINLPLTSDDNIARLEPLTQGVWYIDHNDQLHQIPTSSSLARDLPLTALDDCRTLYLSGALVDALLEKLRQRPNIKDVELVVRDFTRVFASENKLSLFRRTGARLTVLQRSNLLAVTVNPTSPTGHRLNSEHLCRALSKAIGLPVYDLLQNKK